MIAAIALGLLAALLCVAVALLALQRRALRRLACALQAAAHGRPDPALIWRSPSASLDQALTALIERLCRAEQQRDEATIAATTAIEQESARLAALLNDLHEGVLVCNLRHQLVLFNQAALRLLKLHGGAAEMGLGRPLFSLMVIEPLQHCLELLIRRSDEPGAQMPFLSRSLDGGLLLQGRLSLVVSAGTVTGYVVTFDDATSQLQALARRDALLRELIDLLRARGPPEQRLATALARADQGYRALLSGWWPMSDIQSTSLFEMVAARLAGSQIKVSIVGLPVWLHGDAHLLVLALDSVLRALAEDLGLDRFDLAAESKDALCRIVVSWRGEKPAISAVERWQATLVSPALGGLTVRDVMTHHNCEDPLLESRDGLQWLKLALQPARHPPDPTSPARRGEGRPQFFDFNLLGQSRGEAIRDLKLRDVTYVVFDCETTGLNPGQGDRIVALAGVRIVGGRILTGESFSRIVNPERPIPAESVRYHGITDELVEGKPPLQVVLPQFSNFVADAVLVAHNAAFDLKFLRMAEAGSGVVLDNPVLDTMLLSSFIDGSSEDQSLDAICTRYGVKIIDRHSALGDAQATASLFLHLIEALEAKGISTLGEALDTLNMTLQLHQRGQVV